MNKRLRAPGLPPPDRSIVKKVEDSPLQLSSGVYVKSSEDRNGDFPSLLSKGVYHYQVYGIRFVVTYQDCVNGSRVGFDDPKLGDNRRATVAAVLRYIGKHLAEVGQCDILFEASETDGSVDIGEAKPKVLPDDPETSTVFHRPQALAHLRENLGDGNADMTITIDFGYRWHYLDGGIDADEIDFYTVLLRYITQGLGLYSLSNSAGKSLQGGDSPVFSTYDGLLRTDEGLPLWDKSGHFLRDSASLVGAHGGLFFAGERALKKLGSYPRVYTPYPFLTGQSLSTFDPSVAKAVVPRFKRGHKRRTYAPFEVAALADLGYKLAGPLKGVNITVKNPLTEPPTSVPYPLPPTGKNKISVPRRGQLSRDYSVFAHHLVTFEGSVAGNPSKWEWKILADMNSETNPHTSKEPESTLFVFPAPAIGSVSLKVSNSQSSARDAIKLNVLPTNATVSTNGLLFVGHPITFTAASATSTTQVKSEWNFTDGSTTVSAQPASGQTIVSVVHAFAKPGKYEVKAKIVYSSDYPDAHEHIGTAVTIEPTGLSFRTDPKDPIAYQPTVFTAQVNDVVPLPRWYEWNFGDGFAVVRTASPSVVYAFNKRVKVKGGPKTYPVSLKAIYNSDCSGAEETVTSSVLVATPLETSISPQDSSSSVYEWTTFTANSKGNPIDWAWYLDGATAPFRTGKAVESLVFTTTGPHIVKARIFYCKDPEGYADTTATVQVASTGLRIESDPATPTAGTTFTLRGLATSEKDVVAWRWYFLDFPNTTPDRFEQNPDDVRFDLPGKYKIRLKAIYQLNPEWSDTVEAFIDVKPADGGTVRPAAEPWIVSVLPPGRSGTRRVFAAVPLR